MRRNCTAIQTEPVLSEANEEVDDSTLDDNYSTARDDNDRDEERFKQQGLEGEEDTVQDDNAVWTRTRTRLIGKPLRYKNEEDYNVAVWTRIRTRFKRKSLRYRNE